jgi:hypothetical protein
MEESVVEEAVAGGGPLLRVVVQHVLDELEGVITRVLDQAREALREVLRELEPKLLS